MSLCVSPSRGLVRSAVPPQQGPGAWLVLGWARKALVSLCISPSGGSVGCATPPRQGPGDGAFMGPPLGRGRCRAPVGRSPGRHSGRSSPRKALRSSRQTPEGLTPKQKSGYSPWSPEAPEDSAPRNRGVHGGQEPRALGPTPQVPAAGGTDV